MKAEQVSFCISPILNPNLNHRPMLSSANNRERAELQKNVAEMKSIYKEALHEMKKKAFDQSPYFHTKNLKNIVKKVADQYEKIRLKHQKELKNLMNGNLINSTPELIASLQQEMEKMNPVKRIRE